MDDRVCEFVVFQTIKGGDESQQTSTDGLYTLINEIVLSSIVYNNLQLNMFLMFFFIYRSSRNATHPPF